MRFYKLAIGKDAPAVRDCVWLRPVDGGVTLNVLNNGKWQSIQVVDDKGTDTINDDAIVNVANKADKVKNSTNGNLAGLNSKGNLTDSGKKPSDFEPAGTAAAAVAAAVIGLAGGIIYQGRVDNDSQLPTNLTSAENGYQYIVGTAGTYQEQSLAVGDYLIWNGTSSQYDIVKASGL